MRTSFPEDKRLPYASNSEKTLFVDPACCVDCIKEDFNKDEVSQATGFIGQSSEISWIQTLSRELNRGLDTDKPSETMLSLPEPDGGIVSISNYHLDYQEMPIVERAEAYALPSKDVATKLYKTYLDWVHPSFPIIGITPFGPQFQAFFSNLTLRPGNKWLAILNLVFAIAARYAYISEVDWPLMKNDHCLYFSRARVLSMDDRHFHHPDLQQLQVEGLTALYLLALGHINRYVPVCFSEHIRGYSERSLNACAYESLQGLEILWKRCSRSPQPWAASTQHGRVCH